MAYIYQVQVTFPLGPHGGRGSHCESFAATGPRNGRGPGVYQWSFHMCLPAK